MSQKPYDSTNTDRPDIRAGILIRPGRYVAIHNTGIVMRPEPKRRTTRKHYRAARVFLPIVFIHTQGYAL